jgi:signal peptidase I
VIWLGAAFLLGLAAAGWWWLRRRLLIVTVHGPSMLPTYHDGERLLVRRQPGHQVRAGEVVVVDLSRAEAQRPLRTWTGVVMPGLAWEGPPERHSRVIKRAAAVAGDLAPAGVDGAGTAVPPGQLVLLGDNPAMSTDSRQYGFVPANRVLGVVVRPLH